MAVIARVAAPVSLRFSFSFHCFLCILAKWMVLHVPQALVSQRAARETLPWSFLPRTFVLMLSIFPLPPRFSQQRELENGAMARRRRLNEIIASYSKDPQTGIRRPLCRVRLVYNSMVD